MPDQTVNAIVTSPPYWPAKRMYGGKGIGFEATLGEYITSLVTLFREARRVLKDTGVVWIVIDDSYAKAGGKWTAEGYLLKRSGRQKSANSTGMGYQDCSWWRSSCGDVSSNSVASATLRRACDDCGAKKRSRRQTVRIRMAARVWFRVEVGLVTDIRRPSLTLAALIFQGPCQLFVQNTSVMVTLFELS